MLMKHMLPFNQCLTNNLLFSSSMLVKDLLYIIIAMLFGITFLSYLVAKVDESFQMSNNSIWLENLHKKSVFNWAWTSLTDAGGKHANQSQTPSRLSVNLCLILDERRLSISILEGRWTSPILKIKFWFFTRVPKATWRLRIR